MSPAEVLAAFPEEARPISPELKLADGNVVAVGVDGFALQGIPFDVRFVFTGGRLSLVSLRTPKDRYVDAVAYVRLQDALRKEWGAPVEETTDEAIVDLRQTRWDLGPDRADLKYIPGVVALVRYPRPRG
jgi:hypothetical protein